MAKKQQDATSVRSLFPIEGFVANRQTIRASSKNSDHLRKMDIDHIHIRSNFNPRTRNIPITMSEDMIDKLLMISDLADKIYASNGPAHPIIGDIHESGIFYITDGERRYRALCHLIRTGRTIYPNEDPVSVVLVLLNAPGTTDTERKMKAVAANDTLPLSPMQLAFHYLSFQQEEGWSQDQIAKECNVSRQTVGNYLTAATKFTRDVQDKIESGEIKMTNALSDFRRMSNTENGSFNDEQENPLITGPLADKTEKYEKEKEKEQGDEDEFDMGDNSVDFAGSKSGPKEDRSSGEHVIGTDSIYMRQQREALFKRFFNRYNVLFENATKLIVADKPSDEEDEERAAILYEKRHEHTMHKLMEEYDITVK